MKKRLVVLGILMVSLGGVIRLNAYCSFRLFKAPNGKLVMLIGDVHDEDAQFGCHVTTFLNMITAGRYSQPLEILAEFPDPLPQNFLTFPSFQRLIDLKQKVDRQSSSSLRFTSCESRGFVSEYLDGLRLELCKICLEVATVEDYKAAYDVITSPNGRFLKPWPQVKERELSRLEKESKNKHKAIPITTVHGYLASLTEGLKQLENLRQSYQDNKMMYDVFDQYYSRYDQARAFIEKAFEGCPPDFDFFEAIRRHCLEAETVVDLLTTFKFFDAIVLEELDYLLASALMTDHILKRSSNQAPICMVVGEVHALDVANSLYALKWECLCRATLFKKLSPLQLGLLEVADFDERYKQALTQLLEPLKISVPSRVCTTCHKTPEKLVRCGHCKQTLYCDVNCQRRDWVVHKPICQKVKVQI